MAAIVAWLNNEPTVLAVVLFGSHARRTGALASADDWSDIDLQVVTSAPDRVLAADWANLFPGEQLCLKVLRPATSGLRKLTLIYASGEIDLVLVPARQMVGLRVLMKLGLHRKIRGLAGGLNNLRTILSGGYRLLKGQENWGPVYARVVADMPGFRLDDTEVRNMADGFLCDLLWVLKKLQRGELVATQRVLHRSLIETNIVLLHELRLRRGEISYQQARRVEQLTERADLVTVQASARLSSGELHTAAWSALAGLRSLMRELLPAWTMHQGVVELLAHYEGPPTQ